MSTKLSILEGLLKLNIHGWNIHFMQHIKEVKLEPREIMAFYNVKAFCTSIPVDPSINIVKQRLQQDPLLPQRTNMSIQQIVTLLEFCLKNTYFIFQGKYYEQVHGAAMGFPISPLIANLFMEDFKVKVLSSASHPPPVAKVHGWYLCHAGGKTQPTITTTHQLTEPTYTITVKEQNQDGALPFLDILVPSGPKNPLVTTVYRKPTHTNQYLHWDSNHNSIAKNNVFNTLAFRAKVDCTSQQALYKEMETHQESPTGLQCPTMGSQHSTKKTANTTSTVSKCLLMTNLTATTRRTLHSGTLHPWTGGKVQRTCNNFGIQVHFKGTII